MVEMKQHDMLVDAMYAVRFFCSDKWSCSEFVRHFALNSRVRCARYSLLPDSSIHNAGRESFTGKAGRQTTSMCERVLNKLFLPKRAF